MRRPHERDCPKKSNGGDNNSDDKGDDVNGLFVGMTLCQEIEKSDKEILDGIKEEMGIFLGKEEFLSVNVASEKRSSGGDEYWLADTGSQIHMAKADHAMKNETN